MSAAWHRSGQEELGTGSYIATRERCEQLLSAQLCWIDRRVTPRSRLLLHDPIYNHLSDLCIMIALIHREPEVEPDMAKLPLRDQHSLGCVMARTMGFGDAWWWRIGDLAHGVEYGLSH